MKTMFSIILKTLVIALVSVVLTSVIKYFIPGIPRFITVAMSTSFFITYLYVNFDKFSAKQIAIEKLEKKHKVEKTKEQKQKVIKTYIFTWIVFFVLIALVNYLRFGG